MKKTIYFMRHSQVLKNVLKEYNNDSLQITNEKSILSIDGEKLADYVSSLDEFKDIDLVVSSNYVRAMSTAKYFSSKNNCCLVVSDLFGERKHGINSWDELADNFEEKQFNDFDFKVGNGESLNEVRKRMLNGLDIILNNSDYKKVIVVTHATCLAAMLSKWCSVSYGGSYKFLNKEFFDGNWDYLETFKLEFDNDKLISIKNINIDK